MSTKRKKKPVKRRGAPIKFNRKLQERADRLLKKGGKKPVVAELIGISYATLHDWDKRGRPLRAA